MNNFSVLMSVYSQEKPKYLHACLVSITDQSLQPSEVVIVEDGPLPKDLRKVIDNFRSRLKIVSPHINKSKGLGNALNIGLNNCTFEYVVRVDSDDINLKNRFQENINFLDEGYDLIGSYVQEFSENKIGAIRKVPHRFEQIKKFCKSRNPFNHMSVAYKKKVILNHGGYSTDILYKEDYHLWSKLIASNTKMCNIAKVLVLARFNMASMVRRGGLNYAKSEYKLQKFLFQSDISSLAEVFFYGALRFFSFILPGKLRIIIYKYFLRN